MRKVLFVDDEPQVLQGIERMLRRQRGTWETRFVASPEEAIAVLEAEPVDVIVSDMRMPRMDGAALLGTVKERFPGVIRVVLSGHTDLDATLRVIPVAHLFLDKPCDGETLIQAVERACSLQAVLSDGTLKERISSMSSLPSVPHVFAAITRALGDPGVSLGAIARALERDVGMCAKVLRLANSGFFGLPRRVTDIEGAIRLVGTNMLRNLVLTAEIFDGSGPGIRVPGVSMQALQRHALMTASISRKLAPDRRQAEDAFLAGILHDVGVLILATRRSEALVEGTAANVLELDAPGATHAQIGGYLLGLWNLPHAIVEAVAHHHAPARAKPGDFDLVGVLHVADGLAHDLEPAGDHAEPAVDVDYLEAIGMAGRLPDWRAMAAEQAEAFAVG